LLFILFQSINPTYAYEIDTNPYGSYPSYLSPVYTTLGGHPQSTMYYPTTMPTSPSISADLETVNNYLLSVGGTLGGTSLSSAQRTALMNPTGWQSLPGGGYMYKGGVNTQSSYFLSQNPSSGQWNIRSGPQQGVGSR
jgi:hypothetical protein